MSQARLPERIDPLKLAATGCRLEGELSLAPMQRLGHYLRVSEGQVSITLDFGYADRTPFIKGRFRADVDLECQRCMGAYRHRLEGTIQLGIVTHESFAERLPDAYDPLVIGDEPLSLGELVEDELILTLPVVPKHPEGECVERGAETVNEEHEQDGAEKRDNPFAALSVLKTGKKKPA